MINQFHTSTFGDEPADVLAKACDNPGELTSAEFVVLDHYYTVIAYRTIRVKTLGERGSFYTRDQWKTDIGQWNLMFESPAGRAYWRTMGPTFDPEIRSAGDAILANGSYPDCSELYSKWATHIQNELERQ